VSSELRALEIAQASGGRSASDLSRGDRGRSRASVGGAGVEIDRLSQCEPGVAQELGANHAVSHYPLEIRLAIYTINSVESLNGSLREIIKMRGGFPNEEAALKLLFLALRQAAKKWTMPIHHWREALNHFTILWPARIPALERAKS
jgi:putative transposase